MAHIVCEYLLVLAYMIALIALLVWSKCLNLLSVSRHVEEDVLLSVLDPLVNLGRLLALGLVEPFHY